MLRIGIDFDNTIACYDLTFLKVAKSMGYLLDDLVLKKSQVKHKISELNEGILLWQKIQGQVYGGYMHEAIVYPGFTEFLCIAKFRGDEVYIVSHKSEYGHYDANKTNLRKVANTWIKKNILKLAPNNQIIGPKEIHFHSSREEKIHCIDQLNLDIFIDDLKEVLEDINFPKKIEKILFSELLAKNVPENVTQLNTWRKITKYIYGELKVDEVKSIIQTYFPLLKVDKVILKKGRGNSQIYKLISQDERKYALKIYPDIQVDDRPRLATEFSAADVLANLNFPVPQPIVKNLELNWGVYQWIDGVQVNGSKQDFIEQSFLFIEKLQKNYCQLHFSSAALASEACLSGEQIVGQIKNRFKNLLGIRNTELERFLNLEFFPVLNLVTLDAEIKMGNNFYLPLPMELRILSPSDFGSHNAIQDYYNKYYYYDFEYFGWDDPVKLVSDFFWHPGMNLSKDDQVKWLELTAKLFGKDSSYTTRLEAYLPLFGLRWCLIVLNEFMPEKFLNRVHANRVAEGASVMNLDRQLQKSKKILQRIKEMVEYGSKIKGS